MICPKCGSDTKVYGTKKSFVNTRFRVCKKCTCKFITKEIVSEDLFTKEYNDYLVSIGELKENIRYKTLNDNKTLNQ